MSLLDELKAAWTVEDPDTPKIQQRIWDRAAERYGDLPIPSFGENYFLQEIERSIALTDEIQTLDIGCGSGVYSMALAPRVGKAVGVDISPNMIAYANNRAKKLGIRNTEFRCMEWSGADIDALGFRGTFDVVFAHMTPAISDFHALDKLNACSRNLCLMERPTRRKNSVQDEAFRLVGIPQSEESYYGDLPKIFSYLWYTGACPQFYYHEEVWDQKRSVEDMVHWVTDRARLVKPLSEKEAAVIREYVSSLASEGMVSEYTTTTKVLTVWKVKG